MTPSRFLIELNERLGNEPAVLASVMECSGSTPRDSGAQMACSRDWLLGTIGGGAAESKVIDAARQAIGSSQPSEVTIDLRGTAGQIKDGICGGTMLIRLDPIDQAARTHLNQANDDLAAGHTVRQHFPPEACWHLETLGPDAAAEQGPPWVVEPDPLLLIVGAGHCGVALAHAAAPLGFRIILQDDRPEMARPSELPARTVRSCMPIDETIDSFDRHGPLYATLVTRSYQQDVEAMQHLARRPLEYAGLMGSRRRLAHVMKMLREHDVPETFIESIDAPIGIDLPVETPAEIAISICARLIQVRNAACNQSALMDTEAAVSLEC